MAFGVQLLAEVALAVDERNAHHRQAKIGGGAQEVIHVIPDDPVEHARFRVARLVASPGTAHAPA